MSQLDRTIWRGIEILRPADWELSVASPAGKKGRCAFSDRYWQRLDVTWQVLNSTPKIELLLEKFRDEHLKRTDAKDEDSLVELVGTVGGWRGFRQHRGDTVLTRALRFDPETRLVLELAVLWPEKLDTELERDLMAGVRPTDPSGPTKHWRAMGLDVQLDRAYDLTVFKPLAGRTHWEFETAGKDQRKLYIERLATPELWLKGSLADWLPKQAPAAATMLNQRAVTINEHHGQEVLTRSKVGRFGSWRGLYKVRLERAWLCEREARMYRVCLTDVTRDEAFTLPADLAVRCCQPSEAIPTPYTKRRRR
ncbi:MAG: hypothetical protein ACYTFO_03355, partial [Planctomycetota bacterium]